MGFVDSLSHSLSIALSESHTFCTGGSMACFWPKRMPTSYLWRGTFLIGTLPEHSFLFMLIPDNYFNFIPTIPFPSKKSVHSKKTLMFLDYFKGLFQDVLLFLNVVWFFVFLNLLWIVCYVVKCCLFDWFLLNSLLCFLLFVFCVFFWMVELVLPFWGTFLDLFWCFWLKFVGFYLQLFELL